MKKMLSNENTISAKSPEELRLMTEGGAKLGKIKARLKEEIKEGVSAGAIDKLADKLIKESGGTPSFKKVRDYQWATCVNVNEGIVHGIPKSTIIFKKGDVVSVDVGLFYKGFHTDTSVTVGLGVDHKTSNFLDLGRAALKNAISKAKVGNRIYDISEAIETTLAKGNLTPVKALVGHGIGKSLHEDPQIPCYASGDKNNSPIIPEGACLAIEVMYSFGNCDIALEDDGWTIVTADGKLSALFEETVIVSEKGPIVIT